MISHKKIIVCAAFLWAWTPAGGLAETQACPPGRAFQESSDAASAARVRHAWGMLWEIKPPGAPVSHVFGTVHLAEQRVTRLPPAVALALAKADIFVAETALDPSAMKYYQQQMYSAKPPNVDSLFEPPFRERLLQLLLSYGFDRRAALQLRPWAAFTLLARPKPTGTPTLDQLLEATAIRGGKPLYGLQSVQELVGVLKNLPLDHQREMVVDTVCNHALIMRQAQELTEAYLEQDLAGMLAVSSRFESRNRDVAQSFKERLLDDRNREMLARLERYLEQGNAFVAVGALHLPGESGLLEGLEARGYRVKAVF